LSVAQEIAKAQPKDDRNPERTSWPSNSPILTPERISVLVQVCAQNIVDGMLAQDMDDFDGACMHFSLSFRPLFPEFENEKILKASEAYTSALFAQSKIKDDRSLSKDETLHDERWEYVRNELLKMCDLLEIPKSYASETAEWFRYHGVRDDAYVKHLLEAHRVLAKRVAGNDRWYRELAGLYLCAVALHDKHQKETVLRGREIMVNYFDIMLKAREERANSNPSPR
jgi:hypothetical protein